MICNSCGAPIPEGVKFCPECGTPVEHDAHDAPAHAAHAKSEPTIDFGVAPLVEDTYEEQLPGFEVPGSPAPEVSEEDAIPEFLRPGYNKPEADPEPVEAANDDPEFEVPAYGEVSASAPLAGSLDDHHHRHVHDADDPAPQKGRRWVVAACVVGALALGGVAYAVVSSNSKPAEPVQDDVPAQTQEDTTTQAEPAPAAEAPAEPAKLAQVTMPVVAEYLTDEGSRIAVRVNGTAADGTMVDKQAYVSHKGEGLEVSAGTYEVSVIASPISAEGILYEVPEDVWAVVVADDGTATPADAEAQLELEVIAAADVTDEQIEAALAWIRNDPERRDVAEKLGQAARDRRDDALTAQKSTDDDDDDTTQTTTTTTDEDDDDNTNTSTTSTDYDTTDYSDYDSSSSDSSSGYDYDDDYDYGGDTDSGDSGSSDSGSDDSGSSDSGSSDSGSGDSGSSDSGDSGTSDSGSGDSDGGSADADA